MRLARIHGPIFQLEFFGKPLILVGSQEIVNEICDETRFDKRVHATLKNIRDFAGDGLFTARTDEPNWAQGAPPADAGVRAARHPRHVRPDARHRRPDAACAGSASARTAVIEVTDDMTRLTLDTIALCAFDYRFNSFYQREMHPFVGAMVDALVGDRRARAPARHRQQADAAHAPRLRGRPAPHARGRRRADRRAQARPAGREQEGPARPHAAGPRSGHRRRALGREHPLPARHLPDRRARDDQRTAVVRDLLPVQEPARC